LLDKPRIPPFLDIRAPGGSEVGPNPVQLSYGLAGGCRIT
jgi:hypothetical protein